MRHYEMMIILAPEFEEGSVQSTLENYLKVVSADGGKVDDIDVWGKRRLAYDINKRSEGIYAVVDMHATPAGAAELDRQLNLNEQVMRTKLIRPEIR